MFSIWQYMGSTSLPWQPWTGAGDRTLLLSPVSWRNNSHNFMFPSLCSAGFKDELMWRSGKGGGKREIPCTVSCWLQEYFWFLADFMKYEDFWLMEFNNRSCWFGVFWCGFFFWNIRELIGFESSLVSLDHHFLLTLRFRQWNGLKTWVYGQGCALRRWN